MKTAQLSRRRTWPRPVLRLAGGLAALAVAQAITGCSGGGDPKDHVSISECDGSEGEGSSTVSAVVDIENKGSAAASYQVAVTFSSPDGSRQMGSATATAIALAPGQSTRDRVHGEIYSGVVQYECEVADVERVE